MNDFVYYKKRKPMAEINVVPYIDVMLVLLIIFMVTAPLLQQGVDVELPKVSSQVRPPEKMEPIIVSVDKFGNYYLSVGEDPRKSLDAAALQKMIATVLRNKPQTPVLVKGDTHVPYGKVVAAMALIQVAGAEKVGLITEPEEKR